MDGPGADVATGTETDPGAIVLVEQADGSWSLTRSAAVSHVVMKALKGDEVMVECAICLGCIQEVMDDLSEESRERLAAEREKLSERLSDMLEASAEQTSPPGHECSSCGAPCTGEQGERAVFGLFHGPYLMGPVHTICSACGDGQEDLLSRESRERFDDFIERTIPGVPAELDLPLLGLSGG